MSWGRTWRVVAVTLFCLGVVLVMVGCGGGGGAPRTGALDGYVYYDSATKGAKGATVSGTMKVGGSRSVGYWLPLEGATVTLGSKSDTTDKDGRFYIGSIKPGTYTVTVSHPRYMPLTYSVSIVAGQTTHLGDQIMGSFYYVLVGVNDYHNWRPWTGTQDLHYSLNDVDGMYNTLTNQTGNHNWLKGYPPIVMKDAQATKAGIQGAFTTLRNYMWPQDYLVFFFSGHGGQVADVPPLDEYDSKDECLCPYDYTVLRDDELASWASDLANFTGMPPSHLVFIFASCYSGGMIKVKVPARNGRDTETVTIELGKGMESMAKDLGEYGFTILATCRDDQVGWQVGGTIKHSLLTYAIMEAMTYKPDGAHLIADLQPYDGTITADELYQYVAFRVPDLMVRLGIEGQQNPVLEPPGCTTPLFKLVQ